MKLSIITPTLNSIKYIKYCADSILYKQDYKNIEWVIVDGGSKDGTINYLEELDDRRIKIFYNISGSATEAVNYGILNSNSDLISNMGSDDVLFNNILGKITEIFKNPEIDWCVGHNIIIDKNGNEIRKFVTRYKNKKLANYTFDELKRNNFIPTASVFWRRSFMNNLLLFNQNNKEINFEHDKSSDYEMWLRMAKKSKPHIINQNLSKFRMHKNGITSKGTLEQFVSMARIQLYYLKGKKLSQSIIILKTVFIIFFYKLLRIFF